MTEQQTLGLPEEEHEHTRAVSHMADGSILVRCLTCGRNLATKGDDVRA